MGSRTWLSMVARNGGRLSRLATVLRTERVVHRSREWYPAIRLAFSRHMRERKMRVDMRIDVSISHEKWQMTIDFS